MSPRPLTLLGALSITALSIILTRTNAADTVTTLTSNPVYKKECAKCHGGNATGRHFGGPALNSAKARAMSADETAEIIRAGHGRMPSFAKKLTPEQITALASEIRAFQASVAAK